ncbi:MAG: hypothetical protein WD844_09200 [Thermoleophilaceae bacterium]
MAPAKLTGAALTTLALAALAAPAAASDEFEQTADIEYSRTTPGGATGIRALLKAEDPGEVVPKAASKVVIYFARGTRFDTRAVRRCSADSREILETQGKVCRRSLVGTGSTVVRIGDLGGMTVRNRVYAYNTRGGIIFYLKRQGEIGQDLLLRGTLRGRKLTTEVPALPFNTTLTRFAVKIRTISRRVRSGRRLVRRRYVSTPRTCRRYWTVTTRVTYEDGSRESVRSRTRCKKPRSRRR